MFWYKVKSHNSSYYFKMCISEITKRKKTIMEENIKKGCIYISESFSCTAVINTAL